MNIEKVGCANWVPTFSVTIHRCGSFGLDILTLPCVWQGGEKTPVPCFYGLLLLVFVSLTNHRV